MSEYLLEMRGIVKEFSGVKAIDGIDLRVRPGECVGLCGENGAGKSTLVKVLSAVHPYGTWEGKILFEGKELKAANIRETEAAGIVIIHQELMMAPYLSVTENIFLGNEILSFGGFMNYSAMYARAAELMNEVHMPDINVAMPVMNYGAGKQQLIEIAKALNKNAKLLILDEPSSALTETETKILLDLIKDLKRKGVACVYISHKIEEVAEIADTVTVIRDGTLVGTKPMAELDKGKIIAMMVGREIKNLFPREEHPIGDVIFEVKNVTCWDPTNPERKLVNDVSFQLRYGEILGVAGLVGAGRTELMSKIFGCYKGIHVGDVYLEGKKLNIKTPRDAVTHGICMVPEDRKRQGIVPLMAVGHNITLTVLNRHTGLGMIKGEEEMSVIHQQIDRMKIKTAHALLPIRGLSGGNQQKAVVAKMLLTMPKVLILDEPTRGIDVGAKYEIYKLLFELARQGISIIMVSSELSEVLGISDRVLVMGEGYLRGNFVNDSLTQEQVLTAALGKQPSLAA